MKNEQWTVSNDKARLPVYKERLDGHCFHVYVVENPEGLELFISDGLRNRIKFLCECSTNNGRLVGFIFKKAGKDKFYSELIEHVKAHENDDKETKLFKYLKSYYTMDK